MPKKSSEHHKGILSQNPLLGQTLTDGGVKNDSQICLVKIAFNVKIQNLQMQYLAKSNKKSYVNFIHFPSYLNFRAKNRKKESIWRKLENCLLLISNQPSYFTSFIFKMFETILYIASDFGAKFEFVFFWFDFTKFSKICAKSEFI